MMPHVLTLLKKILNTKFEVEPKQVIKSMYDSYEEQCKKDGLPPPKETYAEIELILSQEGVHTRTAVIRIGKGVGLEDRTVTFVDSTRDMLLMRLPNPKLKEGEVILKSAVGEVKIEDVKLPREDWDKAWYNIIRNLRDKNFSEFLTMDDAQGIVKTIGKIQEVNQ